MYGNDVAEDVERRHAGIARARHRLHRGDEQLTDAERLVQRRERHHGHDRRAVRVRDDAAAPSALRALHVEQREMIGVDLGDDERNVLFHAEVLRVAEHHAARARERRLHVAGDGRVERGEDERRRDLRRIASAYHGHSARISRHIAVADPLRRLGVRFARRPLRRRELGEPEPGVIGEQANERLADGAGGAQHRDGGAAIRRESHVASSARAMRSYASTAARSSSTSMNSSVVCAT